MKKSRHLFLNSLVILIAALFSFTQLQAQEEKEEKKVIKMKVLADDDGEMRIDTMIVLDEDFDGDWESITDDEEILEKLKEMDIKLDIDAESNVYIIRAPHTQKKTYFYTTETDEDGNVNVEVEVENAEDGYIEVTTSEFKGDSTITIMLKSTECNNKEGEQQVMIWHTDEEGEHENYKVVTVKADHLNIEKADGDSIITYTIKMESGEDGEDVMIWHSEEGSPESNVIIKEIEGDSIKVFVTTSDDMEGDVKVIKKEVIIITDEEHVSEKDKDKDKKKKKKKK